MAANKSSNRKKRRSRSAQMSDPAQSARFLVMAKMVEAEESGEAFERAMDAVSQPVIARTSRKKASESKK